MSNRITIELCPEDRERIDKLTAALERKACDACTSQALAWAEKVMRGELTATVKADEPDDVQKALAETLAKVTDPVEAPKNAPEAVETSTPTTTPTEEEKPTEKEPAQSEPAKTVTHADVKSLYIKLSASGKKEEAKAIILPISTTISGIPEDKLTECYERLAALEG